MHPISFPDVNDSLSSTEEVSQLSTSTSRLASLRNRYLRGTLCFLTQVNGPQDALTQKKPGFPCSGLNAGSYFISQDEGMREFTVEALEKAIILHLFWTEGLTSFRHIERCAEFIA